jgi:hypothetical protein
LAISLAATVNLQPSVSLAGDQTLDFGLQTEDELYEQSDKLFGVKKPLDQSAPPTSGPFRTLSQTASAHVLLAKDLKAE